MKIAEHPTAPTFGHRKPLAACCCVLFALAASQAFASTWMVTNCNDSGAGSLRAVVAAASTISGDTVDFSSLNSFNCPSSVISLTTGAITIAQNGLVLQGNGQGITGYYNGGFENDRILNHTGTGTLTVENLLIEYNHFYPNGPVKGGCIYSAGNVILDHSQVFNCTAKPQSGINSTATVRGGGVFTQGSLVLKYSAITASSAKSGGEAAGGGAYSTGAFSISNSTINGNYSVGPAGGIFGRHGGSISASTISGNVANEGSASLGAGGVFVVGSSTDSFSMVDSTISGNSAPRSIVGGVVSELPTTVRNSTIAFNTAKLGKAAKTGSGFYYWAAGLDVETGLNNSSPLTLQSSILSNNTYGDTEADFDALAFAPYTITITSDHNLIRASLGPQRPATVTTNCPLLGPLRSNGGPTQTHALLSHSPAIDAGNNNASLTTDQRGTGFARVSGVAPDIGAYEIQQTDIVFNAGFEGCPVLQ